MISLHSVSLVCFSEQDIKLLLNKISEYNLTQQFMTVCNDFITLLQVLALPKVDQFIPPPPRTRLIAIEMGKRTKFLRTKRIFFVKKGVDQKDNEQLTNVMDRSDK